MSAALPCGSSKALPGLMRHPGAPVTTGLCAPSPSPLPWEDLEKRLNLQIFQAFLHASLFPTAFVFVFSNVSLSTGSQPPGWEFMRPVLPELKLVRDGFACLASEHLSRNRRGKAGGAGELRVCVAQQSQEG